MPERPSISIHALREEGDPDFLCRFLRYNRISIHALREEGDAQLVGLKHYLEKISIHALREEGDSSAKQAATRSFMISIHALREEGDHGNAAHADLRIDFNPRPPRGGRPEVLARIRDLMDFNPRPPRGGRPAFTAICPWALIFQSTPSARRATDKPRRNGRSGMISIHALREEGDWQQLQPF